MRFSFPDLYHALKKRFTYHEEAGESFIDSQRRHVFYYAIIMECVCIPLYMLLVSHNSLTFTLMCAILFVLEVGMLLAYAFHHWSLEKTFSIMLIAVQVETCLEIVIGSFNTVEYPRLLIMANILFSLIFIMIAICAYMKKLLNWLTFIPLVGYSISAVNIEGYLLMRYFFMTLIILLLANILGRIVYRNTLRIMEENDYLKKEERKILKYLNLSREELFALVELMSQENSHEETKDLIESIGPQAKENLFKALHAHQLNERTELDRIKQVFPELSASEQTICQLILKDKTINEICEILIKSSGNITSQRTHIRAKLGLKKEDNLKEVLRQRLHDYHAGTSPYETGKATATT